MYHATLPYKNPDEQATKPFGLDEVMPNLDVKSVGKLPESLGRLLRSRRFALAAFLIPVFIRSIPEILVGPYPVGWDTIAFYVPNTLDWAAGKAGFTEILGTAPLMYMKGAVPRISVKPAFPAAQ